MINSPNSKSETGGSRRIGLAYLACLAGLYVYILCSPAGLQQLLARPERAAHALAFLLSPLHGDVPRTMLLLAAYGGMLAVYHCALSRRGESALTRKQVFLWALVFVAVLLPFPPRFSDDIIGYAQHGRVLAVYHENPYLHTIFEHQDIFANYRKYWSHQVSPYGPVMILFLAAASGLGRSSLLASVVLLKLLMSGSYFVSGWLVGKIADRIRSMPGEQAVLIFLWNPLVLFELVGQAHNDAIMIALMLAGLFLVVCRRPVSAFVVLLLSALSKVTTVILLPLQAALLLRRRDISSLLLAILWSMAILLPAGFLFFRDPRAFAGITEVSSLAWLSPTWLGSELLMRFAGWGVADARRVVQLPLLLLFAVFLVWRMTRVNSEESFLREAASVLLAFFLLANNQNNTWYLTLAVAVVAVTAEPVAWQLVLLFTAWPIASYYHPWFYGSFFWANVLRVLMFYIAAIAIVSHRCWGTPRSERASLRTTHTSL